MNVIMNITISDHDKAALAEKGARSMSEVVRDIIQSAAIAPEEIKSRIHSNRMTCNLDLDTATKLSEIADQIGEPAAKVARAILEAYLQMPN